MLEYRNSFLTTTIYGVFWNEGQEAGRDLRKLFSLYVLLT
jgi:hypothetical protein